MKSFTTLQNSPALSDLRRLSRPGQMGAAEAVCSGIASESRGRSLRNQAMTQGCNRAFPWGKALPPSIRSIVCAVRWPQADLTWW